MQTIIFVLFGNSLLSGAVYGSAVKFSAQLSSKRRVVLLSVLSGISNVALYLLPMSGAFKLPIKLLLFAFFALFINRDENIRRAFLYLCVCFFSYFSFEGVTFFFGVDDLKKLLIALAVFSLFGLTAAITSAEKTRRGDRTVKCRVYAAHRGKSAECLALVDTGDLVSFQGKGVIIASEKFLSPLRGETVGKVEIRTPCGNAQTDVFSLPVEIYLKGKKNIVKYAYFAPLEGLNDNDYSLVLPSEFCKETGE